ncbi:MAG: hypothetical protein HC906_17265 [Bacteroidales bacterium]|nr:hypothetical protein [Bacteroidales bacterium]
MKYNELTEKFNLFFLFIRQNQLKEAFDLLIELTSHCSNTDLKVQAESNLETYSNMLKYSFELADDPQKEEVYKRLIKSLTELADEVKEDISSRYVLLSYYREKTRVKRNDAISNDNPDEMIEDLEFSNEIGQILKSVSKDVDSTGQVEFYRKRIKEIFKHIWFTDKLKETEIELLQKIGKAKFIPWHDKCNLISALYLSLFRHFDSKKILLLFDFYQFKENQVWQRALISLVLGLFYYDTRIKYYPEILNRLKAMQGDSELIKNVENIIIQFIKSKETEKVTKKIREEILPEVMKMKSKV